MNDKVGRNASGDSILATLKNNGVKQQEMEWLGLDDYLKGKGKVTKDDLLQHIKENNLQLKEVNLGDVEEPQVDSLNEQIADNSVKLRQLERELGNIYNIPVNQYADLTRGAADRGAVLREALKDTISPEDLDKYDEAARLVKENKDLAQQRDAIRGESGPAKYQQWTLPGEKENYVERLITLPEKANPEVDAINQKLEALDNERKTTFAQRQEISRQMQAMGDKAYSDPNLNEQNHILGKRLEENGRQIYDLEHKLDGIKKQSYESGHFDQPNILAHTRYDTRQLADGSKTLFLEEVQSDWHQAGKQDGYKLSAASLKQLENDAEQLAQQYVEAKAEYAKATAENGQLQTPESETAMDQARFKVQKISNRRQELSQQIYNGKRGVPNAPFKSDWHELVMKRMLREAAEKGYDSLSWTTGEQQAARYDLSKHLGKVKWNPEDKSLYAYDPKGKEVLNEYVDADELDNYVGKEVAEKLRHQADNYSMPDEDSLWQDYGENYRIEERDATEQDARSSRLRVDEGDTVYVVTDPSGYEEVFDSQGKAEDYVNDSVRSAVQEAMNEAAMEIPEVSGLDLKVGGEWAKALYDRAIPNFLNKYAKKWGARVETNKLKSEGEPVQVHTIKITPAMKHSLMKEGQPIAKNDNKDKLRQLYASTQTALA